MHYVFHLLLIFVLNDPIDHDIEYVTSLRANGFYRLSQAQAERLLAKSELTPESRSQVVVELSKTFAAQALNSRPPARDTFWSQAVDVLDEELRKQSDVAAQLLLRSQLAFVKEQQAEWSVREAEIRSKTDSDWEIARRQLRDAIKSLKQVQQDAASPTVRKQQKISDAQLQELRRNIQHQLANAYLHQAIAYRDSSVDRSNALTQANSGYQQLASGRVQDELVWKSRIGRIRCIRMLGQYAQAQKLLKQLSQAPEKHIGAVAAESIRLALDARNLEAAMQLAANTNIDATDPEFQLARIQAYVAAAEQLKGQPKAKVLQQQSAKIATQMAKAHGVYWSLRGEILLSQLALGENADVSLLGNAAETMLRQDSPENAKRMFQRAAEQASQQGQPGDQKAFEFLYKAAVVDHREGRLQPAIDQFRSVAGKYPEHPQASEAHLLAVFDAAALFQQYASAKDANLNVALGQYESLLDEHLRTWPDLPTANQARIWAAKLAIAKRQWSHAMDLYQAVPINSKFELSAYQGLGEALAKWMLSKQATAESLQARRDWMLLRLQSDLSIDARKQLAVVAAKSAVTHEPRDYAMAGRALQGLDLDVQATNEVTRELGVLRILANLGNGQIAEAKNAFSRLVPMPFESLMQLMHGIRPIRVDRQEDAALREFSVELVGLLKPHHGRLSEDDKLVISLAIADAMPAPEAAEKYRQFAKENPRDYSIQLRYAELLSSLRNHEAGKQALNQWRRVVQLSEKQSVEWFRAKLGVAQTHSNLGEQKKANELIEYMSALYPDLGGSELKAQFEELSRK